MKNRKWTNTKTVERRIAAMREVAKRSKRWKCEKKKITAELQLTATKDFSTPRTHTIAWLKPMGSSQQCQDGVAVMIMLRQQMLFNSKNRVQPSAGPKNLL